MIGDVKVMAHAEITPKEWKIPSRSYGISAVEAAEVLLTAEEIKANKPLAKAALASLRAKKKAISKVV